MSGFQERNVGSRVVGRWKIIECVSLPPSCSSGTSGIIGTEFVLSDNGDVTWHVKDTCESLPLFHCQMYEVYTYQNLQSYTGSTRNLLRFAAYQGHVIEFKLEPIMSHDPMLLTYDGWLMLQCEKVSQLEVTLNQPYSLLPALTDGFFCDLTLVSASGRQFPVHRCIVTQWLPSLDWTASTPPLSCLSDEVLEALLGYLYSGALPHSFSVDGAESCIEATLEMAGLEGFRERCKIFARNSKIAAKVECLVGGVKICLETMVHLFRPDISVASAQMIVALKMALRHTAVALLYMVELCVEFESCQSFLTGDEQREIMSYVRKQLPHVLSAVVRLLGNVRTWFAELGHHARQELYAQLLPEIAVALDMVCLDVGSLRSTLEHIIHASSVTLDASHTPQYDLASYLKNDLHRRELQKLRILQENLSSFLSSFLEKREQFEEMAPGARLRGVARIMEHFVEELPLLSLRLEETLASFDELLDWSEFKFVFKGFTSKVTSIVDCLREHLDKIGSLPWDLNERVHHSSFTQSLLNLSLLPPVIGAAGEEGVAALQENSREIERDDKCSTEIEEYCLNMVHQVCRSPYARVSELAVLMADLKKMKIFADMTFIIVPPDDDENGSWSSSEETEIIPESEGSFAPEGNSIVLENSVVASAEVELLTCDIKVIPDKCSPELTDNFSNVVIMKQEEVTAEWLCEKSQISLNSCQVGMGGLPEGKFDQKSDIKIEVKNDFDLERGTSQEFKTKKLQFQLEEEINVTTGREMVEIAAHRVVVAARCDWFKRALTSGMREAIDRRIVIHGCSAETFQLLLTFLYVGILECEGQSPDQLVDLLVLADRYAVDALKAVVESGLEKHIDDESVIPLLTVAHHCNAEQLKDSCIRHCGGNSNVLESEAISQLPLDIQQQLISVANCDDKDAIWCRSSLADFPREGESCGSGVDNCDINWVANLGETQGSSIANPPDLSPEDTLRMNAIVSQLREVVGHEVPESVLVQVTSAADYDLNRALNYFFSSIN